MKKIIIFGLAATLLFSTNSCKKDKYDLPESQSTSDFYENSSTFEAQIAGRILDASGEAIQGASISIGSSSYTSNSQGLFSIISNKGSKNGTVIMVTASGYEPTSMVVYPDPANPKSFNDIVLINKDVDANFDAKEGGTISSQGVEITFSKKSIVDADQNLYEGNVSVNIQYLDPSGSISNAIPGGDLGLDLDGAKKYLANNGTAMVKLSGDNGQSLNIKEGKTAEIKIPLGTKSVSTSETTMELWSYDEQNHYWIQEGFAEKEGNMMVANVSHFSFWSCSSPYDPAYMSVNFVCNGDPIMGTVELALDNGNYIGSKASNFYGWVSGQVPANQSMILTYTEHICGEVIYSGNVGPFTTYSNQLGAIEACSSATTATFEGYLIDCNGAALADAMVLIEADNGGGVILTTDATGYYSGSMIDCGTSSINVTAFDMNNLLQSTTAIYAFQSINNFAIISVCNSIEEYFHYSIDGEWFSAYDVNGGNDVSIDDTYNVTPGTHLSCYINNDDQVSLFTFNQSTGTHLLDNVAMNNFFVGDPVSLYITFNTYSITTGDYVEGTLSGTDVGSDSLSHTIGGNFRIKVD